MKLTDVQKDMKVEVVAGKFKGMQGSVLDILNGCVQVALEPGPTPFMPELLKVAGTTGRSHETDRMQMILVSREVRTIARAWRDERYQKATDPSGRKGAIKDFQEMQEIARALARGDINAAAKLNDEMDTILRDEMPDAFYRLLITFGIADKHWHRVKFSDGKG